MAQKMLESKRGLVLEDDGTRVASYEGAHGMVLVPDSVCAISEDAFSGSDVEVVILPARCQKIGVRAFMGCQFLTRVIAPGCRVVGKLAFEGCSSLAELDAPGITELGILAFANCSRLGHVPLGEGLSEIPCSAFSGCAALVDPVLPKTVRRIREGAFADCASIVELNLPDAIRWLDERAFSGCSSLCRVHVPHDICRVGRGCFSGCPQPVYEPDVFSDDRRASDAEIGFLCRDTSPRTLAEAVLRQSSAAWRQRVQEILRVRPELADAVAESLASLLLNSSIADEQWARAISFVASWERWILQDTLNRILDACMLRGCPCLDDLRRDCRIAGRLGGCEPTGDEALDLAVRGWRFFEELPLIRTLVTRGVLYADRHAYCHPEGVVHVVAEAFRRVPPAEMPLRWIPPSPASGEKVAAMLDVDDLRCALNSFVACAPDDKLELLIPAWALHAWPEERRARAEPLSVWLDRHLDARMAQAVSAACQEADKIAHSCESCALGSQALTWHKNASECQKDAYHALGLDEKGERILDLGGRAILVRQDADGALSLHTESGMHIQKLPGIGPKVDKEKRAQAARWLSGAVDEIERVRHAVCRQLGRSLALATPFDAPAWRVAFAGHPVLRALARGLVWQQNGATFTVGDAGICGPDGQSVDTGEEPILLAHPSEMDEAAVLGWKEYFALAGIEQPFAQLALPALDPDAVRIDRYRHAEAAIEDEELRELFSHGRHTQRRTRWLTEGPDELRCPSGIVLYNSLGQEACMVRMLDVYLTDDPRRASDLLLRIDWAVACSQVLCDNASLSVESLPAPLLEKLADLAREKDKRSALAFLMARMDLARDIAPLSALVL